MNIFRIRNRIAPLLLMSFAPALLNAVIVVGDALNVGISNTAPSTNSYVIGDSNTVTNMGTITIGLGLENSNSLDFIVMGRYNDPASANGEPERILVIGNGTAISGSNALIVYETGDLSVDRDVYAKSVILDEASGDVLMGEFAN